MKRTLFAAVATLPLMFSAHTAEALQFSFADIDGAGQGPAFASQVTVDSVTAGAGQVGFKITSATLGSGDIFGLIKQVNFDDSSNLLGDFDSFIPTNAVDFEVSLKNLPQGNNVSFNSTDGFQAKPPPAGRNANSIRPGDMLTIVFALAAGISLADIDLALGNGDLRLGIHVISFDDGSSDTLVTGTSTVTPVPLPATLPLLLGALAFVGFFCRRSRTG